MMTELQTELQGQLLRYIDQDISLHDFEDYLMESLWGLADSQDLASRELAGHVHNLISEFSHGHLSENKLGEELAKAARPFEEASVQYFCGFSSNNAAPTGWFQATSANSSYGLTLVLT